MFQPSASAQQLLLNLGTFSEHDSESEAEVNEESPRAQKCLPLTFPLFRFPGIVNGVAARFIGLQAFCCCAVTLHLSEQRWTGWMMLALACDFLIRLFLGCMASPVGFLATVLSGPFEPRLASGSPKQFATFLGLCFSGVTAALLLSGHTVAGAVVAAMLLGAAGLEAFCNFCAGCLIFRGMVWLGVFASEDPCMKAQAAKGSPKRSGHVTESDCDSDATESTTASVV